MGTLIGSPSWESVDLPATLPAGFGAVVFNGSSQYGVDANKPAFDLSGAQQFSLMCWLKPADLSQSNTYALSKARASGADNDWAITWEYHPDSVDCYCGVGPSGLYPSSMAIDDTWRHVAFTWDGTTLRGYVDGVEVYSATPGSQTLTYDAGSGMDFFLATFTGGGAYFAGKIADVRLYHAALSADNIAFIHDSGNGSAPGISPSVWYKFEEGSGTTYADSGEFTAAEIEAELAAAAVELVAEAETFIDTFEVDAGLAIEAATLEAFGLAIVAVESAADLEAAAATLDASGQMTSPVESIADFGTPAAECAGTGTVTPPVYAGRASLTTTPATIAGLAPVTAPVYSGSAALNTPPATCAATGAIAAPIYTGRAVLETTPATLIATTIITIPTFQGLSVLFVSPGTVAGTSVITVLACVHGSDAAAFDLDGTDAAATEVLATDEVC